MSNDPFTGILTLVPGTACVIKRADGLLDPGHIETRRLVDSLDDGAAVIREASYVVRLNRQRANGSPIRRTVTADEVIATEATPAEQTRLEAVPAL